MSNFFQIIGSIASLVSIPLAIYLYLKSKENKFDQLKRDVIKILSYQIGDERKLTTFEVQTVINSKLRENRLDRNLIDVSNITEDLVTEVISSPLIDKQRKTNILQNLKSIYIKGEILEKIEALSLEEENNGTELQEEKIKAIIRKKHELESSIESNIIEHRQRLSSLFASISTLLTAVTVIFIFSTDYLDQAVIDMVYKYDFFIPLIAGFLTSILAGFTSYVIKKRGS